MRTLLAWCVVVLGFGRLAVGTDATVTGAQVEMSEDGAASVSLTVSWKNAWRDDRNSDGVWVFCRLWINESRGSIPLLLAGGAGVAEGGALAVEVASDGMGAFVLPAGEHRGDVSATVRLGLRAESVTALQRAQGAVLEAHALEMVFIPGGAFTLGDPDPAALDYGAFYRSDARGEPAGLVRIESEAPIEVGASDGALHYRAQQPQYQGDQRGPIPAEFPKGTLGFWVMKYEITQGQYASFLNSISADGTGFRAPFGQRGYYENRGSIRLVDGRYTAGAPARPANMLSWDDGCAFADWAGLRPMTEFEFTKACRGPGEPIAREYPWNTASKERLLRVVGPDDELVATGEADESLLTRENRDVFGATYFGALDLAGSVWEKCVTIGHPAGRAFAGSHGDGRVTYGFATNADWPRGDADGGGYGYRGGGFYEQGRTYEPDGFNPHSPIAWRRFGAWGGAPRSVAYGMRCVRTAD